MIYSNINYIWSNIYFLHLMALLAEKRVDGKKKKNVQNTKSHFERLKSRLNFMLTGKKQGGGGYYVFTTHFQSAVFP